MVVIQTNPVTANVNSINYIPTKHITELCSSSVSWVSIHFDGSSGSISWISVHCNITTIWIFLFSVIIIHYNLLLELIPILVIQAGSDVSDQCSNNKSDNKCDHYTDSNCCSCRELII